jgi:hypothetical protein
LFSARALYEHLYVQTKRTETLAMPSSVVRTSDPECSSCFEEIGR